MVYFAVICSMLLLLQFAETQKTIFNNKQLFFFVGMPLCLIFLMFFAVAVLRVYKEKTLTKLQSI